MSPSIAAALPALQSKALQTLTSRSPCPVATYRAIRRSVSAGDLTADEAEPSRRRFNAYYGVRRNAAWRSQFYDRFEAAKVSVLSIEDLFEETLLGIYTDTGRVEASFASKLVATLRPGAPIIDSVLRKWLLRSSTPPPFGGGVSVAVAYFRWLHDQFEATVATAPAREWNRVFEAHFPGGGRRGACLAGKAARFPNLGRRGPLGGGRDPSRVAAGA